MIRSETRVECRCKKTEAVNRGIMSSVNRAVATVVLVLAASASAVAVDSTTQNLLGLWVGELSYVAGATLALEFAGVAVGTCADLKVTRIALLSDEETYMDRTYASPVPLQDWLGFIQLVDDAGNPLPAAEYSVAVFSEDGAFIVQFSVQAGDVVAEQDAASSTFFVQVAFCGLTMRAYTVATEADDGSEIPLRVGDLLLVALPGNATTGYEWTVAASSALLATSQVEYRTNSTDSALLGSGGIYVFRFQAADAGRGSLRLEYGRASGSDTPSETVEYTIVIGE